MAIVWTDREVELTKPFCYNSEDLELFLDRFRASNEIAKLCGRMLTSHTRGEGGGGLHQTHYHPIVTVHTVTDRERRFQLARRIERNPE